MQEITSDSNVKPPIDIKKIINSFIMNVDFANKVYFYSFLLSSIASFILFQIINTKVRVYFDGMTVRFGIAVFYICFFHLI